MNEEQIQSLVSHIHDATFDAQEWKHLLDALCQGLNCQLGGLITTDVNGGETRMLSITDFDPNEYKAWEQYYEQRSLTKMDAAIAPIGMIYTDKNYQNQKQLRRSETHNDFFLPNEMENLILVNLEKEGSEVTTLFLRRGFRNGDFGMDETAVFKNLYPHLRQAVRMHSRLSSVEAQRDVFGEVLDGFSRAVFLFDSRGRLLSGNHEADILIAQKDGLSIDKEGNLRAVRHQDNEALQHIILGAARAGSGLGHHPGGAVCISRPSMKRSYEVLITPKKVGPDGFGRRHPVAIAIVTDPTQERVPKEALVAQLYNFTHSEARIAISLMRGLSIKETANIHCMTEHTVRSYLKQIYLKTDTHRQGELIRLLLTGGGTYIPPGDENF